MKLITVGLAFLLASPFALANYENQFCFSGDKQSMSYIDNVTSGTAQFTGVWSTSPPGGLLDGARSDCMGSFSMQSGKYVATGHCMTESDDGSTYFAEYLRQGITGKQKVLRASGKFTPLLNIPTSYTSKTNVPQVPDKIAGCVVSNSRN